MRAAVEAIGRFDLILPSGLIIVLDNCHFAPSVTRGVVSISRLVFSTWIAFGGDTRDLGSFGEETDEITDLHQILEEILLIERGDGVTSIRRCRRDLFSDGV
ncbi:hypothetical protein Tco_0932686 [Tanacetum coccineum]